MSAAMHAGDGRLTFDDALLLDAWERAGALPRPWAELEVLAAASGERSSDLAALPVGERDRRLLELRAALFGAQLEVEAACPACGERLESTIDTLELVAATERPPRVPEQVAIGSHRVTLRPADSRDVAAALAADHGAEQVLVERCAVDENGLPLEAATLAADERDAIAAGLAQIDPGADLLAVLACPACRHAWEASLDPAAFVLHELDQYATRLLSEVDGLARAYGWREPDVLALSPQRRRRYLQMALA